MSSGSVRNAMNVKGVWQVGPTKGKTSWKGARRAAHREGLAMEESTARWVRVEAARRDLSVSAFLGELLEREREKDEGYQDAQDRFLSRAPRPLASEGVAYPSRDEIHVR